MHQIVGRVSQRIKLKVKTVLASIFGSVMTLLCVVGFAVFMIGSSHETAGGLSSDVVIGVVGEIVETAVSIDVVDVAKKVEAAATVVGDVVEVANREMNVEGIGVDDTIETKAPVITDIVPIVPTIMPTETTIPTDTPLPTATTMATAVHATATATELPRATVVAIVLPPTPPVMTPVPGMPRPPKPPLPELPTERPYDVLQIMSCLSADENGRMDEFPEPQQTICRDYVEEHENE